MPPNDSIARQDANSRFTLLGVSAVDGKTPVPIKVNPITGRVLIELFWGSFGDMTKLVYDTNNNGKVDTAELADLATTFTETTTQRKVSDAEKATWNGKQDALWFTAEDSSKKGIANGYAGLDATGKVPSAQLPSFVDDVTEYANLAGFPWTGESGKMYVALDTNKVYRWSGSAYIEISGSPWSTDAVTEGATNLYFTTARVLGTLLTGLSTVTNAVITASDSVLTALGKLQKQITDLVTSKLDTSVFNARTISASTGLTGGWDLSANRSLSLATRGANTIMGNNTGSASTPLDLTITNILDMIGATRGSILFRGASAWSILAPWTSGYALTSQGTGADPAYTSIWGSPVWSISLWSTGTAPTGYLLCDWSAVSRSTYSALFWVIAGTYGTGDGSTTFNLPNLKGRVPVGFDSTQIEFDVLGETGGAKTHTLDVTQIPWHTHNSQSNRSNAAAGATGISGGTISSSGGTSTTTSTGGWLAHNNLQPYLTLNYIIKT